MSNHGPRYELRDLWLRLLTSTPTHNQTCLQVHCSTATCSIFPDCNSSMISALSGTARSCVRVEDAGLVQHTATKTTRTRRGGCNSASCTFRQTPQRLMGMKPECGPHTRRAPRPNVAKSSLVQAEIPTVTRTQLQRYSRHATNVRHSGRPRGWDLLYHSARKGLQDHGRCGKTASPYHQSMLVGALHCDRCPVNTCCPGPPTLQGISVSAPYGLDHSGEYTRPSVGLPA